MLNHPRIRADLEVTVLPQGKLFLMSEHLELVFEGEAFTVLAGLLAGRRSVGEVLALASQSVAWRRAASAACCWRRVWS